MGSSKAFLALASVVVGFLLMVPMAMIFDTMDWPLFHSWGLTHGSLVIAWPVLTLLLQSTPAMMGRSSNRK